MGFTSFGFPLFAAAVLVLYYTVPKGAQWGVLLAASYGFCLLDGPENLAYILFTTLTSYAAARIMARNQTILGRKAAKGRNRAWLALCLGVNFGLLAVCKVRLTFSGALLPLGISFYMFQTLGYVVDVYRGTAGEEGNVFKFALFTAYFPQLVQGPISKHGQLAHQLLEPHGFDGKQVSFGLQRMLWGYFKKLVIADRIAPAVTALRASDCAGAPFLVLTLFYAVQIYGDFTGGIDIALGLSEALGIRLTENFIRPFFSKNVAEYWRRWHISLGAWMKDYIFYPISVSGPLRRLSKAARARFGKFGKRLPVYAASLATWFVTGIWHGLTPNFVVWGMLNCLVIVVSEELAPLYAKFHSRFQWKEKGWYGGFQALRTFLLMNLIRVCDLFPNVGGYFRGLVSVFTSFRAPLPDLGLTGVDFAILGLGIALMLGVSLVQEKKGSIRALLWERTALRYILTFGLFLAVLLMGCYGVGYDAGNFIYNQF